MTKLRLPNTDLANICTMSEKDQRGALERKRQFRPPHSLERTRQNLPTIMGAVDTLPLGESELDRDRARQAFAASLKEKDKHPNLLRFDALWDFRTQCISRCAKHSFGSHRISVESSINLSDPLLVEIDRKRYVPTSDLRKSGRLVQRARDFVFAMNYHLIIDQEIDFEDCGLVILDYWHDSDSNHGIKPYFFDGNPKYSYEDLTSMIAFTYNLWDEIVNEKRHRETESTLNIGLFA